MKKFSITLLLSKFLFAFIVGVGGFTICKNKNTLNCPYNKRVPLFKFLRKEAPNVNAFSIWITKDWKEDWYPSNTINQAITQGYTPIFIFYWFGDDISEKFLKLHKKEYFKSLKNFISFLKKIKGNKIVILNPEYNENGMNASKNFDILQAKSILLIKEEIQNVKVGICLGDFGDYSKIWDEYNWDLNLPSLKYSSKIADFISFQEMRAITRNTKEEILNTPYRALAFALYLNKKFHKPTFLAYLAISSYKNNLQQNVYNTFTKLLPIFKNSAKMFGINIFNFLDVPYHTGYFKKAEKYWGLIDKKGIKKKAFYEFLKFK